MGALLLVFQLFRYYDSAVAHTCTIYNYIMWYYLIPKLVAFWSLIIIVFQKWSRSVKEFFTFQKPKPKKLTESVFIVDNNQDSIVYALYVNGQPVYAKSLHTKSNNNNRVITYTFMSWTVFDRRGDMIMTTLAILCFLMGLILLITPCFEEEEEESSCSDGCKNQKKDKKEAKETKTEKALEKQDKAIALVLEQEMRKGLLEEFML